MPRPSNTAKGHDLQTGEGQSPNQGRMPPLHLLRAFEATARTGTMRRAAEDLCISHTVVSRQVRALEAWMKVKLLDTGPRGIQLSREGRMLFAAVSAAFSQIVSVTADLRPSQSQPTIRIRCVPGLATRWILPRLSIVQDLFGDTDIVLKASDRPPDFTAGDTDIVIGYAGSGDIPVGARLLLWPRMFPVVSSRWLSDHGRPSAAEDLPGQMLIHEETRQHWADWLSNVGIVVDRPLGGPRVSDASLGFDAALSGQGISLANRMIAAPELANGQLVRLSDKEAVLGAYYLVTAPAIRDYRSVTRFSDWLKSSLERSEFDAV